jgi:hypothetical protein
MIQEIVDEVLKRKEHIGSGLISPSGLGQCYRRQFWSRSNEAPSNPIDERTLRVFKCGNIFEEFVVKALLLRYPDWKTQVEVNQDDIHGFADIVSPDEVMDVKSQHSRKFWHNTKEMKAGKDIKQMFYNNWLQVMIYALILGKPRARLVFVSKDDLCIQEYSIPVDDFWKKELDTELKAIRTTWEKKALPLAVPRLYGGKETKKECEYCQFKNKCKEING